MLVLKIWEAFIRLKKIYKTDKDKPLVHYRSIFYQIFYAANAVLSRAKQISCF